MHSSEELTADPVVEVPEAPVMAEPVNGEPSESPAEANAQPAVEELPILAVRDTVLFPNALLPLTVG